MGCARGKLSRTGWIGQDIGERGTLEADVYRTGKRIVDLQCSLALLRMPAFAENETASLAHPALRGLENVSPFTKQRVLERRRLAQLAQQYGLADVMRWKPKKVWPNFSTSVT